LLTTNIPKETDIQHWDIKNERNNGVGQQLAILSPSMMKQKLEQKMKQIDYRS